MDARTSRFTRKFRAGGAFGWDDVDVLAYKEAGGAPFRAVTRQVLFEEAEQGCQLRYFEVAPGGHTTLERHEHVHAVLVLRGRGAALIGDEVREIGEHDLCRIPPMTWHQFRAADDAPLGFLCLVSSERDRPQLPSDADLAALRTDPAVAAFLRI
ncbi:cupin [Vulcanimicrobium alpinum]|uniref:Cupin n=1 Tax=Vulcanimicrobium alpinum TaxID=3016050 RepID=A0AAN1XXQ5_UNVUL|nr:cupin domain-containing protein [Vulcanimicrobium alpinum]BDE07322.1 cupin [Vulcanimicrobium alpinum]